MHIGWRIVLLGLIGVINACSASSGGGADAGKGARTRRDAGAGTDGGASSVAQFDAGKPDAGKPDAAVSDAGVTDGGHDAGQTVVDPCKKNNGGCDPLSVCTSNKGARSCGACPAGYAGDGEAGCAPTLSALMVTGGTLSPAFDVSATAYSVHLPIGKPTITLTPTAPVAASVDVDGTTVGSGSGWTSPTLALGENTITVTVSQPGQPDRVYTVTVSRGVTVDYLKASNTGASDSFGSSVAISGDTLVVGAYAEASAATGVNDTTLGQADNAAGSSGAAYVFVRSGSTWTQQAYLKASNTGPGDHFGSSVAISGDTLVVGADNEASAGTGVNNTSPGQADNTASASGAAYVFVRSGGAWTQQAYLKASNTGSGDHFGSSVAISGDTLVAGAYGEASAATGVNNTSPGQTDNTAANSGGAYVFARSGSTWAQQAYLKASNTGAGDYFGFSVAVSGDTIVAGAYGEASTATGVNNISPGQANNGAVASGAAYVFVRSGSTWTQQAYLKASNTGASDLFGFSVAASGDSVAVGAYGEASAAKGVNNTAPGQSDNNASASGAVYVFVRSGSTWAQEAYLKASNTQASDYFGYSVAIWNDSLVAGARLESSAATGVNNTAPGQSDNSAMQSGAAYLFARNGGMWAQQAYLKASNTGTSDFFGNGVAISTDTLVVGAVAEASAATGVNNTSPGQSDNGAAASGAAYVY